MIYKDLSTRFTVGRLTPSKAGYIFNVYVSTETGIPVFTIPSWRFAKNKQGGYTVYPPAYRVGTMWIQSVKFERNGEFEEMLAALVKEQIKKGNISRNQEDDFDVTQEE